MTTNLEMYRRELADRQFNFWHYGHKSTSLNAYEACAYSMKLGREPDYPQIAIDYLYDWADSRYNLNAPTLYKAIDLLYQYGKEERDY